MNTLTPEYEIFRMKFEGNIYDMQNQSIHIVNHIRTLRNIFQNENLVAKVLICLNRSWKPKVIVIYKSKNLYSVDLTTLFGK